MAPPGACGPWLAEDSEHVSVEWNVLTNLIGREILARVSDERIDRAVGLVAGTLPVQTIMLAFVANQLLRKLFGEISRRTLKILFLRLYQFAARIHGCKFVLTYAPEYDLFFACGGVEIPRAVIVHQGNRKWPVFGSDHQRYRSVRLGHEAMHLLIFDDETYAGIGIFRSIARREDVFSGWPENAQRSLIVRRLHSGEESATGIFRGGEGLLSGLLGECRRKRAAQRKCEQSGKSNSMKALAFKFNKN